MAWQSLLGSGPFMALVVLASISAVARALSPVASVLVVGWLQVLLERERRTTLTTLAAALPPGSSAAVHGGQSWEVKVAPAPDRLLVVPYRQVR
jgi:hypothetical protein